jgi:hypothetical protein
MGDTNGRGQTIIGECGGMTEAELLDIRTVCRFCRDGKRWLHLGSHVAQKQGNEPQYRREAGQWDQTLDRSQIETLIAAGSIIKNLGSGATARELVAELLGSDACDYIAREMERRA